MRSKRSTDFLVHFTVFVQRGQYCKIWLPCAHLAYSCYNLELFLASSLFHPSCSFLSPQSVLCSVEISHTSLLSLHTFTRTWPLQQEVVCPFFKYFNFSLISFVTPLSRCRVPQMCVFQEHFTHFCTLIPIALLLYK